MGMRLTIKQPVVAAPTPNIAKKIEEWDAKVNPDTLQITVPVKTPYPPPLSPFEYLKGVVAKLFPGVQSEALVIPPYIASLINDGYVPVDGPAEDWALLEVWGHFEMAQTRSGKMAGQPPGPVKTIKETADGLRRRPVEHFCALVLQRRGKTKTTKAIAAYALHPYPDAYMHALSDQWQGY